MAMPGQRVEQDELRARMRTVGMTHEEIAVEFAPLPAAPPRRPHRVAHGWTQQQAAHQHPGHRFASGPGPRVNAYAARAGLDPDGRAAMIAPKLCELEHWPHPNRLRPTPQLLALLAEVYGTDIHNLLDLDDREHLTPADQLLVSQTRKGLPGPGQGTDAAITAGNNRSDGLHADAAPTGGWADRFTLATVTRVHVQAVPVTTHGPSLPQEGRTVGGRR
ncbi:MULTISPECIES: hypothetical protein [unclassified Frankia]|uniref:hypothetical protein n=1 Tax=unclassified Frankia TaxID=2632575 RepID=UPI002AD564F2|nr:MULTISPECIES: hypothetical protein [unclassified Frankia]